MIPLLHRPILRVALGMLSVLGTSSLLPAQSGISSGAGATIAVIESAVYSATFNRQDLVNGTFALEAGKRGAGVAILDWSDVRVAVGNLEVNASPAVWGTAPDERRLVVIENSRNRLTGNWSRIGRKVEGHILFDLVLPHAMNSMLRLTLPPDWTLTSSHGLVNPPAAMAEESPGQWEVDLGRHHAVTLRLQPRERPVNQRLARYEAESLHVARRDGIFLQSDILVDRPSGSEDAIRLQVPRTLVVQSISLAGTQISFQRFAEEPELLVVPLETAGETRLTLRLVGFQSARWGRKTPLPRVQVVGAREIRRTVNLRVERPLRVHQVEPEGLIQNGLAQDEGGELWRFEARKPDSRVYVEIDFPKSESIADMICLADYRHRSAWVATRLNLRAEEGSNYDSVIHLPDDWDLISVTSADAESQIASWQVRDRVLTISYQNPMTPTSRRSLDLFARCTAIRPGPPGLLSIPTISDASEVNVRYQVLTPLNHGIDILEGDGWQLGEQTDLDAAFQRSPRLESLLEAGRSLNLVNLRSSAGNLSPRVLVQFVERLPLEQSYLPATLTETSAALRPGMTETRPTATACLLQLSTTSGHSGDQRLVHHAELSLNGSLPAADVQLRLDSSCRVSSVSADGAPVTVFQEDDTIRFPAEMPDISELVVTYVTDGQGSSLFRNYEIPVPLCRLPVVEFQWILHLPADHRLEEMELPGVLSGIRRGTGESRQLFGPLARSSSGGPFHPFSRHQWRELLGFDGSFTSLRDERPQTFQIHAPTVGDRVQFSTMDLSTSRNYAWIALLGCLLIGTGARLFQLHLIRGAATAWLLLLVVSLAVVPASWSLIVGGMLSGSLIAMLLPRRLIQTRDFLAVLRPARRRLRQVTATLLLAAAGAMFAGQAASTTPRPVAATDSWPEGQPLPSFLIRSARYELTEDTSDLVIRATYQILVHSSETEQLIRLPFQDVVFPAGAECQIDGVPHPLIPSIGEDAVLIRLQSPVADPDSTPTRWNEHRIDLQLVVRADRSVDSAPLLLNSRIPAVLDSRMDLKASPLASSLNRWGGSESPDGRSSLLHLGASGQIANPRPIQIGQLESLSAVTLLDVSWLRIRGQSKLTWGEEPFPEQFTLQFPAGTAVTAVSATGVRDWLESVSASGETRVAVRLKPGEASRSLLVSFELARLQSTPQSLEIPPLPMVEGRPIPHAIGILVPLGISASFDDFRGGEILSGEEWVSLGDFGRTRPALAVRLAEPRAIPLNLIIAKPQTSAKVTETLAVQREQLSWTASVQTTVTEVPTFQHRFRVDPAIKVESVLSGIDGSEGPVRYVQDHDQISVFLAGGQLGERTFSFAGNKAFVADSWRTVPDFEVLGATTTQSQLTIRDETFWNIELETAAGTSVRSTISEAPLEESGPNSGRTVGVFRRGANGRPATIRAVPPPQATRVDSTVLLRTPEDGDWELIHLLHFSASEIPLRKANFRVPGPADSVKIRPTHFRRSFVEDGDGTMFTVTIPDRFSDSATLTVITPLPANLRDELQRPDSKVSSWTVPMIEVTSAQKVAGFVLIDSKAPLALAAGSSVKVTGAQLPNWVPADWLRSIRGGDRLCFQQIQPQLDLLKRTPLDDIESVRIALDETILWPMEDGSLRGLTRLWLRTGESSQLRIQHPADITIDLVNADFPGRLRYDREAGACLIHLEKQEPVTSVTIHWTAAPGPQPMQLLQFMEAPDQRLVAVVTPTDEEVISTSTASRDLLSIWLYRWESLLASLSETSSSLSANSSLLNEIRHCQQQAARLVKPATVSDDQRQRFDALSMQWQNRQRELGFAAADEPQPAPPFGVNSVGGLLSTADHATSVAWFLPESSQWTEHVRPRRSRFPFWRLLLGGSLLLALLFNLNKLTAWLRPLQDRLAEFPGWCLALLGAGWWLVLTPSAFGWLLMIAGAVYEIVRTARTT